MEHRQQEPSYTTTATTAAAAAPAYAYGPSTRRHPRGPDAGARQANGGHYHQRGGGSYYSGGRHNPRAAPPPSHHHGGGRRAAGDPQGAMEKAKRLNYKLKDAKDWKGILRQVEMNLDTFNEVNIATALHRLAKIARDSNEKAKILRDPRLSSLEAKAQENMKLFTPQQLSNSAWACATLSYNSMPLLRGIEAEAMMKLDRFNSQDLTNTIWAYAKLSYKPKQLMNGIAREALHKLYDFNPQGLANTLWAFATLNHYGDQYSDLLTGIANEAMKKIQNFNPQNLANSCWAYARLNFHPGDMLLEKIANAVVAKVDYFKPQELANLIWAMAKLNYRCERLLSSVSYAADRRLNQYNPQNLANTCWAYAVLDYHPGPLITKVICQAERCITDFSQQGLSNTVWALAKLQHNPGDQFLNKVGAEAGRKITSFSPQGLVNLALAFACFNKYDKTLLDTICREVESKLHAFTSQDMESMAWALNRLGHACKGFGPYQGAHPIQPGEPALHQEMASAAMGGGDLTQKHQRMEAFYRPRHSVGYGGQFSRHMKEDLGAAAVAAAAAASHRTTQKYAHMQMQDLALQASRLKINGGHPQHPSLGFQDPFQQTESFRIRGESLISGLLDSYDGRGAAQEEDKKETAQGAASQDRQDSLSETNSAHPAGQAKTQQEEAADQAYFSMWQTRELCSILKS